MNAPTFTEKQVTDWISRHYGLNVRTIEKLGSFEDQNFKITCDTNQEFVFKIHHTGSNESILDLQNRVMARLNSQVSGMEFPEVVHMPDGSSIVPIASDDGTQFQSRLITYLPGQLLGQVDKPGPYLLASLGHSLAETDCALRGFSHPGANRTNLPWDLQNALQSRAHLELIRDPSRRRHTDFFLFCFERDVLPKLSGTRHSVVHNDAHRGSVLVQSDSSGEQRVSGLIDFGDTCYTATICNIAVATYDAMIGRQDPVSTVLPMIAAYHEKFPLTGEEIDMLYHLVAARLSIYTCMSARVRADHPENTHARAKQDAIADLMENLIARNPLSVSKTFRDACGVPTKEHEQIKKRDRAIELRAKRFGKSVYTHYASPIRLTGSGLQYLYDDCGNAYLDCVNNVCQLGHCHPHIVRAVNRQIMSLNTNSRYVYDGMTDYANRLTATFPAPLSVCFFVNSGSEANDLALRLAESYIGSREIIVLDTAYHGNSWLCTQISPHRIDRPGQPGLPDFVHKVPVPDTYRGLHRDGELDLGARYAAYIEITIKGLVEAGRAPVSFIAESLVGTGGQFVLPAGYLEAAYARVHAAGGVCIADEVQVGFGRTGHHTWCFESQEVVPDIVTMGKPIGNGHPMAAVVTTPEIAAAFDNGVPYFNTYGGNPVSCAAGMAVLDVLEEEDIKSNVINRSQRLVGGLLQLKKQYAVIGDVRGLGLYIGVEIVRNETEREPNAQRAKRLVEDLKSQQILVNTNGSDNNVIKIKPPLIISDKDVDRILAGLEKCLRQFH